MGASGLSVCWECSDFEKCKKKNIKKILKFLKFPKFCQSLFWNFVPEKNFQKKRLQIPKNIEKSKKNIFKKIRNPSWLWRTFLTPGMKIRSPNWFQCVVLDHTFHVEKDWSWWVDFRFVLAPTYWMDWNWLNHIRVLVLYLYNFPNQIETFFPVWVKLVKLRPHI